MSPLSVIESGPRAFTILPGSVVRLRGTVRIYTGVVVKSEPNKVWLRIGDRWDNCYEYVDGEWIGVPDAPGRSPPRTRLLGVLNQASYTYNTAPKR